MAFRDHLLTWLIFWFVVITGSMTGWALYKIFKLLYGA